MRKFFLVFSLTIFISTSVFAEGDVTCMSQDSTALLKMVNEISNGIGKPIQKDGFHLTPYNLKIDNDCKKRLKVEDLERFYREAMSEGVACLDKLTRNGLGPLGREINSCLLKLFEDKTNPPKLLCGGWPFGENILAVGSFPGSAKRHPYLWLSPSITDFKKGDINENKGIMFHEMIHNCGFMHSEGVEVTMTCEECCFNKKLSKSQKQNACNICAGKYTNENDSHYVRELIDWSKDYPNWSLQQRERSLFIAIKYKNKDSLKILVENFLISDELKEKLIAILLQNDKTQLQKELMFFSNEHHAQLGSDRNFQHLLNLKKD